MSQPGQHQYQPSGATAPCASRRTKLAGLLVLAWSVAGSSALSIGCSSEQPQPDPVPVVDMATAYNYKTATIAQIDADPGNGPFGNGERVVLDRVVAVSKVDKYVNSTNVQCRYQMWIQDAKCTTPPCGMVIKAIGPMAPSATASGKDCPDKSVSGTLLAMASRDDNLRVRGKIIVEVDSTPPATVVEHQLFIETLEVLTPDQTITPLVISDSAVYTQFQAHLGKTWNKYEGMYVTIQPAASGVLTVSKFSGGGFETTPGPVEWGNVFDNDYYPSGVSMYPTVTSTFHAISGVVSTRHGGELMPTRTKDFTP